MSAPDLSKGTKSALVEIDDLVIVYDTPGGAICGLDGARIRIGRGETLAITRDSRSGQPTLRLAAGRPPPPPPRAASRLIHASCRSAVVSSTL